MDNPSEPVLLAAPPEGRAAIVSRDEPVVVIVSVGRAKVESRIRIPICGDTDAEQDAEDLRPASR